MTQRIIRKNDLPRRKFRKLSKIPYGDAFDRTEMKVLMRGLFPEEDKDRWFVYFEKNTLFFHRSNSGQGVYQVRFKLHRDGSGNVRWAKASKDVMVINKHYEAAILDFLIAHVILGYDVPFPRHNKLEELAEGEFQRSVAGTECEEELVRTSTIKGQFR